MRVLESPRSEGTKPRSESTVILSLQGSFSRVTIVGDQNANDFDVSIAIHSAPTEFELQKQAFESIPPLLISQYAGQFVASIDGQIVDSDSNIQELAKRFFLQRGFVPAYITRVGAQPHVVEIDTPFFD